MFQKILLPVDLVERHRQAIDIASQMTAQNGGSVTLLHVIETIGEMSLEEDQSFYRRLDAIARRFLDRLGQQLGDRNIAWQAVVRVGHRASETVHFSLEMGSDLIILTAPRFDPANPGADWGSLSFKISLLAQCPVLMVKAGGTDEKRSEVPAP